MFLIFGLALLASIQCANSSLAAQLPADKNAAVVGVVKRLIPKQAAAFRFELIPAQNGRDVFELDNWAGGPVVRGSSVSAVLEGVNWYLKYYCNAHVSWTGDQLKLPAKLPRVPKKVRIASPYKYRYIWNYCTFNYSMSFWDWPRWERELDFIALNGVNLALAVTGQEAVWRNTLRRFGYSDAEVSAFIPGPAYQAWWLMGNLEGWGGPVSQRWIDSRAELQRKIMKRMRELGIEPILQGFYGMVPVSMMKKFPAARIYETGLWCEFKRPAMIDPTDPFFRKVAAVWYEEQRKLYGDAKFYGGDPFHEGGGANINLTDAGREIQNAMLGAQPGSTWVIQGWQSNPKKEMLDGTKKENTLILDLFADAAPQWKERQGLYGHPWVWCIISNFGGKTSLFGAMNKVARDPVLALNDPDRGNMVGIGAIMEASEMDDPLWDLLYEMGWRSEQVDPDEWIAKYARRRYGRDDAQIADAWKTIRRTAYESNLNHEATPISILCVRPALRIDRFVWGSPQREYNPCELAGAWKVFIDRAGQYRGVDTFEHDTVDLTRQVVANLAIDYLADVEAAWNKKDVDAFRKAGDRFLGLLTDQDKLLSTDGDFLMGRWIERARALGKTPEEKDLFERNARTLVTTWGPEAPAQGLRDYANREWAGLLSSFYFNRWKMFFDKMADLIVNPPKPVKPKGKDVWNSTISKITRDKNVNEFDPSGIQWFPWEEKWTMETTALPSKPVGNRIDEAKRIFEKYGADVLSKCAAGKADAEMPKAPPALPLTATEKLGPISDDLFHVQGISVSTDTVFITSVYNKKSEGYLWRVDRRTNKVEKKVISELMMYHPGGLQVAEGLIYVPIAVYTEKSYSKVLVLDAKTLKLKKSFKVPDHIGLAASDGSGRIYGGNWDALKFYVWDDSGKLLETRDNPTAHGYQDCKVRGRNLVCSGTEHVDFISLDSWKVVKSYRIDGLSAAGNLLTREGMDFHNGRFYFNPDDGAGTFMHVSRDTQKDK